MLQCSGLLVALLVLCCPSMESAAVFLPTNFQGHVTIGQSRRPSKRIDNNLSIRRRSCWKSFAAGVGFLEAQGIGRLAFTPYQATISLSLMSALGSIGRTLQSESMKRAIYFWFHAGPVVLHYKFTRWHLTRTNAPLQKRDRVYNNLHDRYCQRCLNVALHLRGLYVKVRSAVILLPITLLLLRHADACFFSCSFHRLLKLSLAGRTSSLPSTLSCSLQSKTRFHNHQSKRLLRY